MSDDNAVLSLVKKAAGIDHVDDYFMKNSHLFQTRDGHAIYRTYHLYEVKKKNAGGEWQVFRRTRWQ